MPRDFKVYIEDILEAIEKIERYSKKLNKVASLDQEIIMDAVIRNLEIMGEAVKSLPINFREQHSDIEWKKIAGLRDILIHDYFGIDWEIIWDIIEIKIPLLREQIRKILELLESSNK